MRQILTVLSLAAIACLAGAGPAQAACTGLGSCSCSVSAPDITFGDYNPISASNIDTVANINVTCTVTVVGLLLSYEVEIGAGGSGDQMAREMARGADRLSYNLYRNVGRTIVWGDGAGGTGSINNSRLFSILFPWNESYAVYGRLPAGQSVPAGAYVDTLVATVIY